MVARRGEARATLLHAVKRGVSERCAVSELAGPLAVLWLRELDGDEILDRAAAAYLRHGGDAAELRLALMRYLKRYPALALTPEEDPWP